MMRRKLSSLLVYLFLSLLSLAQGDSAAVRADHLKAKAETMGEHERGRIYAEIAFELTEKANDQFTDGQPDAAQATVQEVIVFAEKASSSAKLKNKKLKDTEINLRKTARRLEEVGKTLSVEDRPKVTQAVERLDAIRKDLLEYLLKRG